MIGTVGNIYEYFLGFRKHATEFLGTGELNESEFQRTSLGNKEETSIFCWEQWNMHPLGGP